MASTGQSSGLPDLLRPMTSPRTPFFWEVKVRVANVAVRIVARGAASGSRRWPPTKSCTSCIRNGVVSDFIAVYSPGRKRKKKASAIISAVAWLAWLATAVLAKATAMT